MQNQTIHVRKCKTVSMTIQVVESTLVVLLSSRDFRYRNQNAELLISADYNDDLKLKFKDFTTFSTHLLVNFNRLAKSI